MFGIWFALQIANCAVLYPLNFSKIVILEPPSRDCYQFCSQRVLCTIMVSATAARQAAKAANTLEPIFLKERRMCLCRPVAQQKEPKWMIVYGILVICVICISLARALAFFEATFRLTMFI